MPPEGIATWQQVEAWLTDDATWAGLATFVLRHDAMSYRTLLLEIVQAPTLCPLGVLSFLEQYARWAAKGAGEARLQTLHEGPDWGCGVCIRVYDGCVW